MNYYQIAQKASSEIGDHPGLRYLKSLCDKSHKILDVGCGEGTRLATLSSSGYGIDLSKSAVNLAKKKYPQYHFSVASGTKIPFQDNYFDLVYSAFVLEHTADPEKFLLEMIRVCKPKGYLVILCPNFGAPNRRSPNSTESPLSKFITGLFSTPAVSAWTRVNPKQEYTNIDDDTTIEPFLGSLPAFFCNKGFSFLQVSSCWELEPWSGNPRKSLLKLLGSSGIPPFKFWGPQIFLAIQKV